MKHTRYCYILRKFHRSCFNCVQGLCNYGYPHRLICINIKELELYSDCALRTWYMCWGCRQLDFYICFWIINFVLWQSITKLLVVQTISNIAWWWYLSLGLAALWYHSDVGYLGLSMDWSNFDLNTAPVCERIETLLGKNMKLLPSRKYFILLI